MVTLHDGSQVPEPALAVTMVALNSVLTEGLRAANDLLKKCKDPEFQITDDSSKKTLKKYQLIEEDGGVHDTVSKIVVNAARGNGVFLHFLNPVKKA